MLDYIGDEERRAIISVLLNCDGKSCFMCEYIKACKTMPFVKNVPQLKKFMVEYRKTQRGGRSEEDRESETRAE